MARTKQTARKSTGGMAPRRQLATASARDLRTFMTSQQQLGQVSRAGAPEEQRSNTASYLNHENVIGSFGFATQATDQTFLPQYAVTTAPHPQTGLPEHWLSLQFTSKYDGDGFTSHARPPLSLMLVLDISGSMGCQLEEDTSISFARHMTPGKSKLDAAKRCLLAILGQLTSDDCVGVLLFNHETHALHASSPATPAAKAAIAKKLGDVRAGGGTSLERGYVEGMRALAAAKGEQPLRRLYFLTDMMSHLSDEQAVLNHAKRVANGEPMLTSSSSSLAPTASAPPSWLSWPWGGSSSSSSSSRSAKKPRGAAAAPKQASAKQAADEPPPPQPLHTTVVGMGVDLSVGTVEAISSLPGGKYASVSTASEFERAVGAEFKHDVVPLAFGIRVALEDGWAIERACGSAELNSLAPGATHAEISSEFASPHDADGLANGGIVLFKLRPPPPSSTSSDGVPSPASGRVTRQSAGAGSGSQLRLTASWTALEGGAVQHVSTLTVPPHDTAAVGTMAAAAGVGSLALRKALALVRFVDLQKGFCDTGDAESEGDLDGRLARLDEYRRGRDALLAEMGAVGEGSILQGGRNHAFLQTLEQIIELETTETTAMKERRERAVAAASAAASASSAAASSANRPGAATRAGKRGRAAAASEPPRELVCPILHTLMTDPVSTADGHTFERAAIERWLSTSNNSPLTGLRLPHKNLTPNHALRALAQGIGA